jgi:dTDP-4-dehydrorhamnose 3,5-epimerase
VRFSETTLAGPVIVEPEPFVDARGLFARTWCAREFDAHGLCSRLVQSSVSLNTRRGTLRGMHFQTAPFAEVKLVRCTRGAILDVIIDLRPESPTFTRHFAVELTEANHRALYIPEGFAHGFQTLEDGSEVLYQMSEFYVPDAGAGVRWNDPTFAIAWPIASPILNERDATYPDFAPPPVGRGA